MSEITVFDLLAGAWSTGVIILVGYMMSGVREEIKSLREITTFNFERINGRLTKCEDRVYDLSKYRGNHNGRNQKTH